MDYVADFKEVVMDSAFNAIFPPNSLVCVHVYLFISIFFVKSHLAIGLQCSDALSLFSLTHETRNF